MKEENEIWKVIPGFDGFYEVSNKGRVRSWKNTRGNRLDNPKYLKPSIGTHGYLTYGLHKNNKPHGNGCVHRLVAEAFIPNPNNYRCINHKNGIKTDNRIGNLEWCTYKHNIIHAFKNGLSSARDMKGEEHPMSKLTKQEVAEIREKFNSGKFSQMHLSEIYKTSLSNIGSIVKNNSWHDDGYVLTSVANKSFNNPPAQLTDEEVLEIRLCYKDEDINQDEIARRYGVEANTVSNIIRNKVRYDSSYKVPNEKLKRRKRYVGKLTEKDALIIRDRYNNEPISQTDLAEIYGVNQSAISRVINRKNWSHI